MDTESIINEVKRLIKTIVPKRIKITNIDIEGPELVIYTKNIEEFAENNDLVKDLAQGLRRRVAIRPDPGLLID
ncbi:MAG: beta-CASP ribonuclease aCPSF1, partial [Thermoplasmata archaeon]|nr:beta-CASP ribonuclease aCPSF1 [Thermoplasmata archaeon]